MFDRRCWIFDMDGTLTVAVHDFDAIRRELGIAPGRPILEALSEMDAVAAAPLHRRLADIELELARDSTAAPGALEFVHALKARGDRLGILTRNTLENARVTLEACGMDEYFEPGDILGRLAAAPKPSPEGIRLLLDRWDARPEDAVMVGDFRFDLEAGRAAGTATLYVTGDRSPDWKHLADETLQWLDAARLA
ncbi:MAG: HAD family hydrolase [Planctomycetota bacterium]